MTRFFPRAMREAPVLRMDVGPCSVKTQHALLLNPFYPKDPHASFGKHVLTPSLALTSIAAATRRRHLAFRERLLQQGDGDILPPGHVVSAGV